MLHFNGDLDLNFNKKQRRYIDGLRLESDESIAVALADLNSNST